MSEELSLKKMQQITHRSISSSVTGYLISILLTVVSFLLVYLHLMEGYWLMGTIAILALVQAAVQLKFFLHLGEHEKPNWEALVFFFTLLILAIVGAGSIWVMHDLDERMMSNQHEMSMND